MSSSGELGYLLRNSFSSNDFAVTDMRPVARDGCPVNRDAPAISHRLRVRGRAIDRWKANGVSYTLVPVRTAEGKDFLFGSRSKINTSSGISRSLS